MESVPPESLVRLRFPIEQPFQVLDECLINQLTKVSVSIGGSRVKKESGCKMNIKCCLIRYFVNDLNVLHVLQVLHRPVDHFADDLVSLD